MHTDIDTPARWRRRKEARPQEILDAALMVFAEKGYASARMDDIAARAGVTKGTIYLYFDGKEAVFKTLVRDSIGDTLGRVAEAAGRFEGSASELLRGMLRTIGQFVCTSDRVVLPKIVIAEFGNFPELARFYRDEVVEKGLTALGSVISRGVARGEFRDIAPEHAARLCIAPILLAAVWRTTFSQIDSEAYDLEGLIDTHIEVLLRGLACSAEETP